MYNRIILNETSYFGPGAIKALPGEIAGRNFKKAFLVTDEALVKFGVVQKVVDVLKEAGVAYEIYDKVKPNPTIENVQTGVAALQAAGADFIIAVGGGSPIDTAKGIGIVINNPEFNDVRSLEGVAPTHQKSFPVIAIPTTAGTAAEVTINYVITDEQAVKKMVCVDPHDIPMIAIVDPELMVSMPKGLTAATGMDALTHAIEGYITKGAWEMTNMFELKAIELIARHLQTAVQEPENMEARNGMALAQYIAGMGFSNVGLGIVHSMAHPLGAFYDTPHGVANALLLPYVMEYNAPATGEKYLEIARALGVQGLEGMDADGYRRAAVNAVIRLSQTINIPQKLREIDVREEDLPKLAKAAFQDVCTPGNPRDASEAELLELYRKAF
ncbi:lactaldehyde reductase [Hydrogenispora ethanolica]|jgi:lactaldehyde reductase|uniref:Lactaldehyde reductase n=1 Tax=Hydrogenispora ethanolica TaxID=1082276 RepID=A0A4R1RSB2_HYDET|nr:lactaldehyde reductase [Hydrogenispora ethanolica]TCL69365.1 lactaldehyde reductase [Hydrogenispora ethanolica]